MPVFNAPTVPLPAQYKPYQTVSFAKPDVTAAGSSGAWNTPSTITLFTVTGTVKCSVYGVVGATAITSTGNTGVLSVGAADGVQIYLNNTTVSGGTQFKIGAVWVDTTPTQTQKVFAAANLTGLLSTANIILTISVNSMTAGSMTLYCDWVPVSAGATVVAATP